MLDKILALPVARLHLDDSTSLTGRHKSLNLWRKTLRQANAEMLLARQQQGKQPISRIPAIQHQQIVRAQMLKLAGIPATPAMLGLLERRKLGEAQAKQCGEMLLANAAQLEQEMGQCKGL